MSSPPAIAIHDLTKSYAGTTVVDALSLDVAAGSTTVLLGPNGAGKSTTLEIVSTLRTPTSGTVTVCGHDIVADPASVRRTLGLTPQANSLDPLMTPEEALSLQACALRIGSRTARARTDELLTLFALGPSARQRLGTLSGGTRRRVDLALALVAEPSVIILDEPTTGLDPLSRMDLWNELRRLNQVNGTTLLVSTQDLHEAEVLASDLAVLRQGRLVAHGTPAALKRMLGAQTLLLTLASVEAHAAVTAALTLPTTVDAEKPHDLRVHLGVDDSTAGWPTVLGDLGGVAQHIVSIRLDEPTLDDVFRHLALPDTAPHDHQPTAEALP